MSNKRLPRAEQSQTLLEAALAVANVSSEDDAAYERAVKALEKFNQRSAEAKAQKLLESLEVAAKAKHRAGIAAAMAEGRTPGPPRLDLTAEDVHREVSAEGSLRRAARALGVSAAVLHKILKKAKGVHKYPIREQLTD